MKKICILWLLFSLSAHATAQEDYTRWVDPFIGTQGDGNCFPGATAPFGMVQPGPESMRAYLNEKVNGNITGYKFDDPYFLGFTQTRLNGVGCPSMSDILIMPYSVREVESQRRWEFRSTFDAESQVASPGFYSVYLDTNHVKVDITATPRVAYYRCHYDDNASARMLVDLQYGVGLKPDSYAFNVDEAWQEYDSKSINGFRKPIRWAVRDQYYTIEFSHTITHIEQLPAEDERERAPRYIVEFDLPQGDELEVYISISTTSVEAAKANLAEELPVANRNFEQIHSQTKESWNQILSVLDVEASANQKTMLYTSLYHMYVQPNDISDVDGLYRSAQDKIRTARTGKFYSTLSLWDTYRATHPLYTLLTPKAAGQINSSIMEHYISMKEANVTPRYLPRWALWGKETNTMIGNHAVPVLVDGILKGIPATGFSDHEVWEAIHTSLTTPHYRNHVELIDHYGYIPYDDKMRPDEDGRESVARLLEGSFNDYCAAIYADKLGDLDREAKYFWKKSQYYRNVYDQQRGFMNGRSKDGGFREDFNPNVVDGEWVASSNFTEACGWQYLFHVQHDIEGLMDLMGGKAAAIEKLDSIFYSKGDFPYVAGSNWDFHGLVGRYWHGNEPCHHVPYLYRVAGESHKTEAIINFLTSEFYRTEPHGLSGNDDCGQMSAWYLFSSMGFYPVNPCAEEMVIGAPQVEKITLRLENGNTFTIIAENISKDNIFVQSVSLNGQQIEDGTISYSEIMKGGELRFKMYARDDREALQDFKVKYK